MCAKCTKSTRKEYERSMPFNFSPSSYSHIRRDIFILLNSKKNFGMHQGELRLFYNILRNILVLWANYNQIDEMRKGNEKPKSYLGMWMLLSIIININHILYNDPTSSSIIQGTSILQRNKIWLAQQKRTCR
ncbi:hypothetical protein ACJX0J_032391 [Zea mays]